MRSPSHCLLVNTLLLHLILKRQPKATATSQACCPIPGKVQMSRPQGKTQNQLHLSQPSLNHKVKTPSLDSISSSVEAPHLKANTCFSLSHTPVPEPSPKGEAQLYFKTLTLAQSSLLSVSCNHVFPTAKSTGGVWGP